MERKRERVKEKERSLETMCGGETMQGGGWVGERSLCQNRGVAEVPRRGGVPGRGRARGAKEMTHAPKQEGVRGDMERTLTTEGKTQRCFEQEMKRAGRKRLDEQ